MARRVWMAVALAICAGCGNGAPSPPPPATGPLEGAPITPPPVVTAFTLGLPKTGWTVDFSVPGEAEVTGGRIAPDGSSRSLMALAGRYVLSVWMDPATATDVDAAALRDRKYAELEMRARSPLEAIELWEADGVAGVQFLLPTIRGIPVRRLERHCFLVRDAVAIHASLIVDQPPPTAGDTLAAWSGSMAIVPRATPPASEALVFAQLAWNTEGSDALAEALGYLDIAAAGWTALQAPQRSALARLAAKAYPADGRAAEGIALLDQMLADAPAAGLHYARAQLCAAAGRVDGWATSLRAAFADPAATSGLPDPRDDPEFVTIPAGPFEETLRAIGR